MGTVSLTNAYITVGGNDISDHCSQVTFDVESAELDATVFSSTGWTTKQGGLKSANVKIGIKNDYAAAQLDSILWALLGTVVAVEIKPVNSARSTSNPSYTGSVLISKLQPINGAVGDLAEADLQWPSSGAFLRATS